MILLTLISSKQKTLVNLSTIIYTVPNKLGTEIVFEGGIAKVAVTETAEEILRLQQVWHESCTNSTNSTNSTNIAEHRNSNPTNTTKNNSDAVVGEKNVLIINDNPIPVDPSVKIALFDYCKTNEPLLKLFGYWMDLYEKNGGQLSLVSSIDLGTLAKVVRTGTIDKAQAVFDWLFTSDHYRAVYLRSRGMVNPAVVVSSRKIDANYALSQQKPLPALPTSAQRPSRAIPTFDENGNIIGGNNG